VGYSGNVKDVFLGGTAAVVPLTRGVPITQPDPWTQYAVVRDATGLATLYRNGWPLAGGWADGPKWLQLGGYGQPDPAVPTDVAIAELVVYNRAITAVERRVRRGGMRVVAWGEYMIVHCCRSSRAIWRKRLLSRQCAFASLRVVLLVSRDMTASLVLSQAAA
jgi:hypothetical protein